jgi:phosphoribosylformylglycinamidine synthase
MTADLNENKAYKIPIAHGEGRYFADEETLKLLNDQGQVMFRYCESDGAITDSANPNGAIQNIAGVCNEGRNVMGMMPHPERAADENLLNTDGLALFHSLLNHMVTV